MSSIAAIYDIRLIGLPRVDTKSEPEIFIPALGSSNPADNIHVLGNNPTHGLPTHNPMTGDVYAGPQTPDWRGNHHQ